MAKTTGPALSFRASGSIAKTLVYGNWKGIGYARERVVPANPRTTAQVAVRGPFGFLAKVFQFGTTEFKSTWQLFAQGQPIIPSNGFIKANQSNLIGQTTLADLVFSNGAKGGLPPGGITVTAGATKLTVVVTAPSVPTGWTVAEAIAVALRDQDPNGGTNFTMTEGTDNSSPYSIELDGLLTGDLYRVGAWFKFTKPDGTTAYGASVQGSGTPT